MCLAVSGPGVALGLPGCGDDGGGGAGTATSSGPGTSGGPGESGSAGGDTASGPGSDGSESDGGPAGSTGTTTEAPPGDSTDGTTGAGIVPIDLTNDGWADNGAVFFQGGFAVGECWGSTFVPEAEHYPFEVIGARMVVGGEDAGSADFTIAIWSVDETGQPLEELSVGTTNINGDDNSLDSVPLDVIGVEVPPITEGEFAIVVCFADHAGFPGIAADSDGLTHRARNWIRLEDGTGANAADLGVSGDFITRATILPQDM
jgi:hypothetical protein